jgi:AcrR family transcriptional regulator
LLNALKLFARRGLTATKISDIAETSGFSQGLVYHYFDSKETLYTELVKQAVESSNQVMLMMEQLPLEPLEKINTITTAIIQGIAEKEENAYYFLLMTQALVSEANPDETKDLLKFPSVPFEVMVRIMNEGKEKGVFPNDNPADLVMLFWSAVNGLALSRVAYREFFSMPDPAILIRIFQK